ncbi:F-box protein At5g07610-like [Papaver somniferum]|uniref:F-box protein At5g07610-like n=1 Tax=Papaver somniferum TaxID=3469 RepID=UPI000E6F96E5|nr:F-box protein At5g07610-like [Papaver somniferum]
MVLVEERDSTSLPSSCIASNKDAVTEILLRLPALSLVLFKSVSKGWNSLISDPYFVHTYSLRNRLTVPRKFLLQMMSHVQYTQHQIISHNEIELMGSSIVASTAPMPARIEITQSCNGLLCGKKYKTYDRNYDYYIINPSTKCCKILPPSPFRNPSLTGSVCSMSLVFDSQKSKYYQVVCIMKTDYKNKYQIEIYSSETKSWRLSGEPFSSARDTYDKPGVFWNGNLHWIRKWIDYSRFDIEQESLKTMPVPPRHDAGGWDSRMIKSEYFGECNGHLYFIEIYHSSATQFDILEMESDYSRWNVRYRVNLEQLIIAYPSIIGNHVEANEVFHDHYDFSVLLVDEDEKSSKLVLQIPGKTISYDLNEMSFKGLFDLPNIHSRNNPKFSAHQYMDSVVSV